MLQFQAKQTEQRKTEEEEEEDKTNNHLVEMKLTGDFGCW